MANKTFQGRIIQKHDTKANWDKATNFVPLKGEIIVYDDLNKIKIGDGTTKVGDLAFINDLDTLATVAKTGSYSDLKNKRTVNGSTNNIETNFYVNFTQEGTTDLEPYTADKTIEEIKNAYNHGYNIVGKIANASSMGDLNLPLAIINPTENIFCFMGFGDTTGENVGRGIGLCYIIYVNGSWSRVEYTLAFYDDLPDLATVATSGSYNDLLDTPTIPTKLSNLTDDVVSGKYLSLTGGTMTGNININNKTITNLKTPTADTEAANKKYVDDQIAANSSSTTIITWSDDGT